MSSTSQMKQQNQGKLGDQEDLHIPQKTGQKTVKERVLQEVGKCPE